MLEKSKHKALYLFFIWFVYLFSNILETNWTIKMQLGKISGILQFSDSVHNLMFVEHPIISNMFYCVSARRGRIYLPQDELAQFGLSDEDIFAGKVTDRWRAFMKDQIKRARMFFDEAEKGVTELDKASRWPVCYCF